MGELPALTLPIIAAVLGGFYEIDNTPEPEKKDDKDAKPASKSGSKVRVAEKGEESDEEADEAPRRAKK